MKLNFILYFLNICYYIIFINRKLIAKKQNKNKTKTKQNKTKQNKK